MVRGSRTIKPLDHQIIKPEGLSVRVRNEARVGIIVFAGIVALIVVYWFLGGLGLRASMYKIYAVFDNAQRLQRGAEVRLAGVKVGRTSDPTLTAGAKARVVMHIENGVTIPSDSVARITTGGIIGEYLIDIRPGKSRKVLADGARIRSAATTTPEDLMEGAHELLHDLQQSVEGINALVADETLPKMIRETVASLKNAAESAAELVATSSALVDRISPDIAVAVANTKDASRSAAAAGADLHAMIREDLRPGVMSLLASANKLMQELDASVGEARGLIEAYKGGGAGLEKALAKAEKALDTIDAAAAQGQQMLAKLNEASTSIRELATDEQIKADLKKTIRNTAEVSGQLKEAIDTITRRLAPGPGPSPEAKKRVPEYGLTATTLVNTGRGQSRFDAYYTFIQGKDFYRVGGYNIGENTQLIAQGGSLLGLGGAFRYGIYASRVGFGYDQRVGRTGLFSLDLFRPNEPELELKATVRLADWLGLYWGMSDLLHSEKRDLLVGLQYRR